MPTLTINRSDTFPVGTSVAAIAEGGINPGGPAKAATIASATVGSDGALSITDAGIVSGTMYGLYASVGGEHRYLRARSTLDVFDTGTFTATGDTTASSATVLNASASSGAIQAGMRISGTGIPANTYILTVASTTLTLSTAATATATGVTLKGDGAYTWRAKVRRRRAAISTS